MSGRKLRPEQLVLVDAITDLLVSNGHDVEELAALLHITEEDIYERFKDRIYQERSRFSFSLLLGGTETSGRLHEEDGGDVLFEEDDGEEHASDD